MTSKDKDRHVEERFKQSIVFGQYFDECMETERTLRGNCWNHEVLILNCNTLIEKFIKSGSMSMERFFRSFVVGIVLSIGRKV